MDSRMDKTLRTIELMARSKGVATPEIVKQEDVILCCLTIESGELPLLPDNQIELCGGDCGRWIQFRPQVAHAKKKVCEHCALKLMNEEQKGD